MSTGKVLTTELVFMKTKSSSLEMIKIFNMWGNDLEDLSLMRQMPNLEVVSLSVNRIRSLKYFRHCSQLQELYLRKNHVADIHEIRYLTKLEGLKVLWLHDNPCAQVNNYRQIVIKYLPRLVKLDNTIVTEQERAESHNFYYNMPQLEEEEEEPEQPDRAAPNTSQSHLESLQESPQANMHHDIHSYNLHSEENHGKKLKWKRRHSSGVAHQMKSKDPQEIQARMAEQSAYVPECKGEQLTEQRDRSPKLKRLGLSYREQDVDRNQNIVMGIILLMRQLDTGSLEILINEARKLQK